MEKKTLMKFLILCLVYVIRTSASVENDFQLFESNARIASDDVESSHYVTSQIECATLCASRDSCQSFSISNGESVCRTSNVSYQLGFLNTQTSQSEQLYSKRLNDCGLTTDYSLPYLYVQRTPNASFATFTMHNNSGRQVTVAMVGNGQYFIRTILQPGVFYSASVFVGEILLAYDSQNMLIPMNNRCFMISAMDTDFISIDLFD